MPPSGDYARSNKRVLGYCLLVGLIAVLYGVDSGETSGFLAMARLVLCPSHVVSALTMPKVYRRLWRVRSSHRCKCLNRLPAVSNLWISIGSSVRCCCNIWQYRYSVWSTTWYLSCCVHIHYRPSSSMWCHQLGWPYCWQNRRRLWCRLCCQLRHSILGRSHSCIPSRVGHCLVPGHY